MPKRPAPTCVLVSGGLDSAVLLGRLLQTGARLLPVYIRCGFSWEATELHWLRRFLRAVRSLRLAPLRIVEVPLRPTYGERSTSLRAPSRARSRDGAHWGFTGRRVPGAASADAAVYLPGRNVLLLSHAAILCAQQGMTTIALGTLKGNPFGDATPRFFRDMAACLSRALGHPIRVRTPLARWTKPQVIRSMANAPFALTFSCLAPRKHRHCGRCNKCAERRRAFRHAGVPDPTPYAR